jgi:diguanylate cyclase (GGDEF)-like protein
MAVYTLIGVARILLTLFYGSPANFLQRNVIQSSALILNVIFVCIIGLCFLLMLSGELMDVLENQSFEDLVSGALNRRGIEQKLAIELGAAKRSRMAPSIALIDIDHFKAINDTEGHAAGDDALRLVAHSISSHLRDYDYLGRYGGDEFLLILPQASYLDALKVIERVQQAIRALPALRPELTITLSIGVTQAVPFESADIILARADAALYKAKRAGRNCCQVLPPTQSVEIPAAVAAVDSTR